MAEEMKKDTMNQNEEQQNTTPDGNVVVVKKNPIKDFFKKNGSKIKVGLGVAGAIGVGIAADRLGIKFGSKKKPGEEAPETTTE